MHTGNVKSSEIEPSHSATNTFFVAVQISISALVGLVV